jgi:hypothetical protein
LGDGEDGARYVTNVAGRGYCFVASVTAASIASQSSASASQQPAVLGARALPPRLKRMAGRDDTVRTVTAQLAAPLPDRVRPGCCEECLARASTDCMFRSMAAMHPAVQALLDLFATSLADVRFADIDGPSLARCAAEVEAAAQAEAGARSALDAAHLALQEKQEALLQRAQRALAYARV